MLDVSPRLRDALTREFLIGGEIAYAKDGKGGLRKFKSAKVGT